MRAVESPSARWLAYDCPRLAESEQPPARTLARDGLRKAGGAGRRREKIATSALGRKTKTKASTAVVAVDEGPPTTGVAVCGSCSSQQSRQEENVPYR